MRAAPKGATDKEALIYLLSLQNNFIRSESMQTEQGRANTGCFEKEFKNIGEFHQWGCAYEEFKAGPGNYTVAIVEDEDGDIHQVLPQNIRFIS